jgi:1,4-dihydroxy-2-naphthoate polyprenyltransferase
MRTAHGIVGPMRLPFLALTPACVLVGVGAARSTGAVLRPLEVALVLVGALAAHISVNVCNEYCDFRSGLDARTRRTPFSGGSGTLPGSPELARAAGVTAGLALALTAGVGLYFILLRGLALLPLGLAGVVIILAYTPWLTHHPLLCLLAPGLGFGPLMVLGTQFALAGRYTGTAVVASLVPLCLVSDLLLLNQFPDTDADRTVGRRHVLIVLGPRIGGLVYGLLLLLAYLAIAGGVAGGYLPRACLLGLATFILALPTAIAAVRHGRTVARLIPYLACNVLVNLLTPVLVAVGLFIG